MNHSWATGVSQKIPKKHELYWEDTGCVGEVQAGRKNWEDSLNVKSDKFGEVIVEMSTEVSHFGEVTENVVEVPTNTKNQKNTIEMN